MDNLTKKQRQKNMRNIRSKGTAPERKVMRELRKRKIYFAKHVEKIIGKPDIVFRRKKIVVFIDSDFWHGHPDRFIMPKTNTDYWRKKISRNKERDIQVTQELNKQGWTVIRLWEYDINKNFSQCIGGCQASCHLY
jgi:DNA mismatch endonuclease (patch repair protein)